MSEILLGVTGGIAAYKAVDVLRMLQRRGHEVTVVMTSTATRFVGAATFAALSGRPVGQSMFGDPGVPGYNHLDVVRGKDLFLIAPASANTIAHMAVGTAQGLLTSCYLAFEGPVLVAPAMNTRMYLHPATVDNLALLEARGAQIIPPGEGLLADGDVGPGRLAEPVDIVAAVEARLAAGGGGLRGRRVLVTAGGTREPLDAVRYVGNRSSGRMGDALAAAALARGAQVTMVAANIEVPRRPGVRYVDAPTAAELRVATLAEAGSADLVLMAAAVADYRPRDAHAGKIDKSAQGALTIELERTEDVLTEIVAGRRGGQVIVGFAAEHGAAGLARAREKRARKGVDVLVFNDVSQDGAGFGAADNEITIIGPGEAEEALPRMSKAACAERILDVAQTLLT
ncbi:MAG: bifunctional phosphopantothenoylcysteine decarboxylase/phosphopantothenate--cysteine ligase CoaBC [Actinomycetota bacterium]